MHFPVGDDFRTVFKEIAYHYAANLRRAVGQSYLGVCA
jgi:hypothetical protein